MPWIVVVFAELFGVDEDGAKRKNYYVKESVGIACGLFIAALHRMGLATLTHTPSPMGFLSEILERPRNEKPFILFPVGFPAPDCEVPDLRRKSLAEVAVWNPGGATRAAGDGRRRLRWRTPGRPAGRRRRRRLRWRTRGRPGGRRDRRRRPLSEP